MSLFSQLEESTPTLDKANDNNVEIQIQEESFETENVEISMVEESLTASMENHEDEAIESEELAHDILVEDEYLHQNEDVFLFAKM